MIAKKTFFSRKLPIRPLKSTVFKEVVICLSEVSERNRMKNRFFFPQKWKLLWSFGVCGILLTKENCNDCKFVELVSSLISNFLYSKSSSYMLLILWQGENENERLHRHHSFDTYRRLLLFWDAASFKNLCDNIMLYFLWKVFSHKWQYKSLACLSSEKTYMGGRSGWWRFPAPDAPAIEERCRQLYSHALMKFSYIYIVLIRMAAPHSTAATYLSPHIFKSSGYSCGACAAI